MPTDGGCKNRYNAGYRCTTDCETIDSVQLRFLTVGSIPCGCVFCTKVGLQVHGMVVSNFFEAWSPKTYSVSFDSMAYGVYDITECWILEKSNCGYQTVWSLESGLIDLNCMVILVILNLIDKSQYDNHTNNHTSKKLWNKKWSLDGGLLTHDVFTASVKKFTVLGESFEFVFSMNVSILSRVVTIIAMFFMYHICNRYWLSDAQEKIQIHIIHKYRLPWQRQVATFNVFVSDISWGVHLL